MRWSTPLWLIGALAAAWLSGCGGDSGTAPGSADRGPAGEVRVVSLSPAISRTLSDLGLGDRIVGRTPFCSALDQSIPVVGDLHNVDYERLIRLEPTHVLIQPPARGADPRLAELARVRGWAVAQWRIDTLDDIETLVRELPGVIYLTDSPERDEAARRAATLVNDMAAALSPETAPLWRGSVLLVSNTDPVTIFGTRTFLHDVLVALGATNAASVSGWAQLSLEDVARLNPRAIVFLPYTSNVPADPLQAIGPLGSLEIEAVRERRIAIIAAADALTPSTAVIEVAREIRHALRRFAETRQ